MHTLPKPQLRFSRHILLAGVMRVYGSQAEAAAKIPAQWVEFVTTYPGALQGARVTYGASPCTSDGNIHYLCGVEVEIYDGAAPPDRVVIEEGEYAVFTVNGVAELREAWPLVFSQWLPNSGRRERRAPEFELYDERYQPQTMGGEIEMWIPLEPA